MKFRCERDTLVEALGTASRAVSGRGGMLAVLSGLKAELLGDTLTLTGSDLALTIQVGAQVSGSSDGTVVFPRAKLLADVVRSLPSGAVGIEVGPGPDGAADTGGSASITSGRSEFSLRVVGAEEYPKLPITDADPVQLEAGELSSALRQVTPAASTDDNRPIITGVLLAAEEGGLRLVATDSYRLAVRDLAGQGATLGGRSSVLVPSRALREVDVDLQERLHEDMRRNFHLYPKRYGLKKPDRNIDHRRAANHVVYLRRHARVLPTSTAFTAAATWQAGDLVYWGKPDAPWHCGVVSDRRNANGLPWVIHNISGAREEDALEMDAIAGHFRLPDTGGRR